MALILPLISFLAGYWGVHVLKPIRPLLAALLARLFIPLLIIYNMVFYKEGSLWLIGFSLFSSIIFFSGFYYFQQDKLRALCFSYLNGAWLGLPFALAVFGPEASSTIVALYIGGSLFGNICAVMAVSETRQDRGFIIKNVALHLSRCPEKFEAADLQHAEPAQVRKQTCPQYFHLLYAAV